MPHRPLAGATIECSSNNSREQSTYELREQRARRRRDVCIVDRGSHSARDVSFFEIIDGRLVLQHNKKAWDLWRQDVPGNLKKADGNWPGLVEQNGL